MKRKRYSGGTHEEALDRLCFVCGEIIKDNRSYTVEKNLDLLGKALNCPDIFTIPDVTPTNLCKKCHLTLSKVSRGEIVITGRQLLDWMECGPSCSTCALLLKRKEGGSRKKVSMFQSGYFLPRCCYSNIPPRIFNRFPNLLRLKHEITNYVFNPILN